MKKKLLSLVLVFAMTLTLAPWAMAAEVRETDFFEDLPHSDLDFDQMQYRHLEVQPMLETMERIRALMGNEAEVRTVAAEFDALTAQIMELMTMYTLVNIQVSMDATSETYSSEYLYTYSAYMTVVDAFSALCRDLLASPCASFLKEQLSAADLAYYTDYQEMSQEDMDLAAQEQELTLAYQTADLAPITVEHQGETLDQAAVEEAYSQGALDDETYDALLTELVKAKNAVLGEIYLDLVAVRQKIAKAAGYDNYADYAYEVIYTRDYTPETIVPFLDATKAHMADISTAVSALLTYQMDAPALWKDYTGEDTLDTVEGYLGQMSSELLEAFTYMRSHKLYDTAYSDTKQPGAFTTMLPSYGAPFYYGCPSGDLYDFSTVIHEFGHYQNFYWSPAGWNDASSNIDVSEVHSQGLELLFSHYYGDIFGDEAQTASDFLFSNLTNAFISGCLMGELELYAYTTKSVTLDQLNAKYLELMKAYGLVPQDDPREEAYGWVEIPHLFTSPCYYISYAVSVSGAFSFWLMAQEGEFTDAVDQYLTFCALPAETGFQDSFKALDMADPLSADYIAALAEKLMAAIQPEERLPGIMLGATFTDLSGSHWYDDAVLAMVLAGLFTGYEDGSFRPGASITWGQALKTVLLFLGEEEQAPVAGGNWSSGYRARALELGLIDADVEQNAVITRQEIAQLLCRTLEIPASETPSPFTDEADGCAVALSELGILTGITAQDGTLTFQGGDGLTRAQFCAMLYRTALMAAEEMPEEMDAAA